MNDEITQNETDKMATFMLLLDEYKNDIAAQKKELAEQIAKMPKAMIAAMVADWRKSADAAALANKIEDVHWSIRAAAKYAGYGFIIAVVITCAGFLWTANQISKKWATIEAQETTLRQYQEATGGGDLINQGGGKWVFLLPAGVEPQVTGKAQESGRFGVWWQAP
ncbi:hypothetical protein FACS1894139_18120 [Planctomycetales bacterium]|nr:hypothetical protein FACS1894139_18120 [Planctomycetales bacterium]GHV23719.1 hypothetical protein AGMMS49959_17700 [Planctomycetales bacterium]